MRSGLQKHVPFSQGFLDQLKIEGFQIPQTAMYEFAGSGRRSTCPIALINYGNFKATERSIIRRPRAVNTATADKYVECLVAKLAEISLHCLMSWSIDGASSGCGGLS